MSIEDFSSTEFVPSENGEVVVKVKIDEIKFHAALVCGAYEPNYNIKLATHILCKELKDNDTILSLLTLVGLDDPSHDVFNFTEELREIYAK